MKHFLIGLVLMLAVFTAAGCVPHTTGETEVGVRTRKMAFIGSKGVEDRIYAPGATYFFMPFINDWHVFDTKLQNLEMTYSQVRGDRKSRDDLVLKTIDGNDISLDVIILPSDGPHGVNPLNLDNAMQLFDVRKGGAK